MAGRALALLQDAGPGRNGRWALLALVVLATWLALEQLSAQLWFLPAGLRLALLWLTPTRRWGWLAASEIVGQGIKSLVLGFDLLSLTFLAVGVAPWFIYAAVVYLLRRYSTLNPRLSGRPCSRCGEGSDLCCSQFADGLLQG